jgi:KEOPS complex subunit Cgi121
MLKIIGATGKIQNVDKFLKNVGEFAKKHDIIIQAMDADMIYGKIHLNSAFEHAKRAIDQKTNTTNSFEMEILLYASGERQLKLAIPKMGVKKGNANVAFVLTNGTISDKLIENILEQLSLTRNDKVLVGDEYTLKKFGINKHEFETVTKAKYGDLILEKVAMVDIIK